MATRHIIAEDFLVFYGGASLYWDTPAGLYEYPAQVDLQRALIAPTPFIECGPFSNPPQAAFLFGLFLPFSPAVAAVSNALAQIAALYFAALLMARTCGAKHRLVLLLLASTPAFAIGTLSGQVHGITVLLVTGIAAAVLSGRTALAGVLCGLLLYKPQYTIGFLVLFLARRYWRALGAFAAVAAAGVAAVSLTGGFHLFTKYAKVAQFLREFRFCNGTRLNS